jgi:hypothetical protein
MRVLGVMLLILALIGALLFVPTGYPATYGRVSSPSWELVFSMNGNSRVIDTTRLWIQTLFLTSSGIYCLYRANLKQGHNEN